MSQDPFSFLLEEAIEEEKAIPSLHIAHYTNLSALESILKKPELWFSHPWFMNDSQEMNHGLKLGIDVLERVVNQTAPKYGENILGYVENYLKYFEQNFARNIYIACFCEYDADNSPEGILSMWRAYGANGGGIALVLNTDFMLPSNTGQSTQFIFSKVHYFSDDGRTAYLEKKYQRFFEVVESLSGQPPIDQISFRLFHFMKLFSLFAKHRGFREEQEWRMIYMPDYNGPSLPDDYFSYNVSNTGVEPKLKMPLRPIHEAHEWSFDGIVKKIILGPAISSDAARVGIYQMLDNLGYSSFKDRVSVSDIPLRAIQMKGNW